MFWSRTGTRQSLVLGATAAILVAGGPLAADPRSLIDPGEAHARRELRSLDARASTSPRGAAIQLERGRRDITRPGPGIDYLPEGARLEREFDRIERDIDRRTREPRPQPERALVGRGELPRSYGKSDGLRSSVDGGNGTAPGGGNNLVAAARLLNRAETAIERGKVRQARSDLASARGFLDDVEAVEPVAVRRAALAERLATLENRATAAEED